MGWWRTDPYQPLAHRLPMALPQPRGPVPLYLPGWAPSFSATGRGRCGLPLQLTQAYPSSPPQLKLTLGGRKHP